MTINKGYLFNEPDGFPLNQQRLEWMQAAYSEIFDGLTAMIGNNVIVSGCIIAGNTVSDGWVVLNGTLYPFKGTTAGVQAYIHVREIKTPLTFKNGQKKEVQFYKYAEFGSGEGAVAWSALTRLYSIKEISEHLNKKDNPHSVTKAQIGLGNLPNAKTDNTGVSDSNILATSKMVNDALTSAASYSTRALTLADFTSQNREKIESGQVTIVRFGKCAIIDYDLIYYDWVTNNASVYLYPPAELGELVKNRWIGSGYMGYSMSEDDYGIWQTASIYYVPTIGANPYYRFAIPTNSIKGRNYKVIHVQITVMLK